MTHVLRIDASARKTDSVTRSLADQLIEKIDASQITTRDLSDSLPHIDEAWVNANFTPADQRDGDQQTRLAQSDSLVDELAAADIIVIGLPIYNFGVPASFKAWIDMVARVGRTFKYSEAGPKGLLEDKRAIVIVASGGTELDSEIDFAGPYVRHVLGFMGITDVTFVRADRLALDAEGTMASAKAQVDAIAA